MAGDACEDSAVEDAVRPVMDRDDGSPDLVTAAGIWTFRLILVGSIAGGIVLHRRRVPISPLVGVIVVSFLTIALLYFATRFRAPADLAMTIMTAAALEGAFVAEGLVTVRTEPNHCSPHRGRSTSWDRHGRARQEPGWLGTNGPR